MRKWLRDEQPGTAADDCDFMAAALTALFDGEATPEEASKARTHLITCPRCADVWAGWNHTRYLYQQIPIAAPPGLLHRILIACRLATATEVSARATWKRHTAETRATLPPAPPGDLHAQILRRTTRNGTSRAGASWSASRAGARAWRGLLPRSLTPVRRYGPATALPAMLLVIGLSVSGSLDTSLHSQRAGLYGEADTPVPRRSAKIAPAQAPHGAPVRVAALDEPGARTRHGRAAESGIPVGAGRAISRRFSGAGEERAAEEMAARSRVEAAPPRSELDGAALAQRIVAPQEVVVRSAATRPARAHVRSESYMASDMAALPSIVGVAGAVTRVAPAALNLMRRVAAAPRPKPSPARAMLTPVPAGATPELASYRGGAHNIAFAGARPIEAESASDSDSFDSVRDFGDNRPESVKSVIESFRAALDAEDDELTTDG